MMPKNAAQSTLLALARIEARTTVVACGWYPESIH
jgi:hypothetical protein